MMLMIRFGGCFKVALAGVLFFALFMNGCAYRQTSFSAPHKLAIQEAYETDDTYFETSLWRVALKKNQPYLGMSVIRLKRVCGDTACVTKEEWEDLHRIFITLEDAMRNIFGATMFNEEKLMNHAFQNRPYAPLVHIHFTPRYEAPVAFAGEIFTDERFGHRARLGEIRNVPESVREQIKFALRNYLHNVSRP